MAHRAGTASGHRGMGTAGEGDGARRPLGLLVGVAALACAILAADAKANTYYFDPRPPPVGNIISSRHKPGYQLLTGETVPAANEYSWSGPRVIVRGNTTNTDYYDCSRPPTRWIAVADDVESATRSFTSTSDAYLVHGVGNSRFNVTTTNWSSSDINIRVVSSCTSDYTGTLFPYVTGTFLDWLPAAAKQLLSHTLDDYLEWLVDKAFGWDTPFAATVPRTPTSSTAASASHGRTRFALRNGKNRIAVSFKQPRRSRRPPSFYLTTEPAAADCSARRMHTAVIDGAGGMVLTLSCDGVRKGATGRLLIRKAIRRTFRLRQGDGTVKIHLDKPPGRIEPLVYLRTRRAKAACKVRDRKLRLGRRTLDLRLDAHCGLVGRRAVGKLYVGGLLAGRP